MFLISLALLGCTEIGLSDTSKGPVLDLVLPVDGGQFDPSTPVEVCGSIEYSGDLSTLAAVVATDRDGILATSGFSPCPGGDLGVEVQLSDASQVLSMTVTDVQGRTSTDSVSLQPLANTAPRCEVLLPADGALLPADEAVDLSVRVEDDEGGLIELSVESTADGVLDTTTVDANSNLSLSLDLGAGPHDLLLTVQDDREDTGVCVLSVELVECTDGPLDTCDDDGDGFSELDGDCDDSDFTVFPDADEVPDDGVDQDCNLVDATICFVDSDGDGWGGIATTIALDGVCDTQDGEADDDLDCDDGEPTIYPGAPEVVADGIDQDCDGSDSTDCFEDLDGDGWGTLTPVPSADADCLDPGEAPQSGDCDDTDPGIHPAVAEVPDDGIDQDCSGSDTVSCFVDSDGDGVGTSTPTLATDGSCDPSQQEAPVDGDCDDTLPTVYPGAPEVIGDGTDQDCNGADSIECFEDLDQDSWGNPSVVVVAVDGSCDLSDFEADRGGDCDDSAPLVNPDGDDSNASDGIDSDCDGVDGTDADGDGYSTAVDCDDSDPAVNPGATEVRDGLDQNCDGMCDEGLIAPGDLVITEILIAPDAVSFANGEWFEIYNPTAQDITLCGGWVFADQGADAWALDQIVTVPAGGYVVAGDNADPNTNGGAPIDIGYDRVTLGNRFQLGDSGDEALLIFNGVTIFEIAWSTAFDTPGQSQQLDLARYGNAALGDPNDWCDSTSPWPGSDGDFGSPGAPNETCP